MSGKLHQLSIAFLEAAGYSPEEAVKASNALVAFILAVKPDSPVLVALPETAPELYKDRSDRQEDPISFYKRVWGQYHQTGSFYQDDLRKLDPHLIPAVRAYCQRMARNDPEHTDDYRAADHLPPPRKARLDNLVAQDPTGIAARLLERKRAGANKRRGRPPSP